MTSLLQKLAEVEGVTVEEMLEAATFDCVAPGICECGYTTEVEPDCRDGWCSECEKNTIKSCLVLAGLI